MTIFWHGTGPLLQYDKSILRIANLNPEVEIRWRMSRFEMLKVAARSFIAAIWP